jgi:hypothetical protein
MEPYVGLVAAFLEGSNADELVARIAELPLEQRYVWRVVSALEWAFADFDNLSVAIDRTTLTAEDKQKVVELLKHRPMQCIYLKTFLGQAEMLRMMVEAIKVAKEFP